MEMDIGDGLRVCYKVIEDERDEVTCVGKKDF